MKIEGSTFVVTGGASGLGEACVRLLASRGANVAIFDLNEENGPTVVKSLPSVGGSGAAFFQVDITDTSSVQAGLDGVISRFGALHGVVNAAGVGMPCKVYSPKRGAHPQDLFETVVRINLFGSFNVLRLAVEKMVKNSPINQERGVILNVASVAAWEGQIGQAAYSASKGAVVAMTLPIAREVGKFGIRVNTLAPGVFETAMTAAMPPKLKKSLESQIPFPPRLGVASEFASMAVQMLENQYVNGTAIRVDGAIRMGAL